MLRGAVVTSLLNKTSMAKQKGMLRFSPHKDNSIYLFERSGCRPVVRSLQIAFKGSHGRALSEKPVKISFFGFARCSLTR